MHSEFCGITSDKFCANQLIARVLTISIAISNNSANMAKGGFNLAKKALSKLHYNIHSHHLKLNPYNEYMYTNQYYTGSTKEM